MPQSKKKVVTKSNLGKEASTITRLSAPTVHDQHPRGTSCKAGPEGSQLLYIQNSQDENNPCWELMGPYTPPTEF